MPMLMSQIPEGPILDYASPLIRAPLRLAEKSILTFFADADGLRIVESLAGKGRAIAAICFCGGSMIILGCTISDLAPLFSSVWLESMATYSIFAFGTLALILTLINSNWRRTVLKIGAVYLTLVFESPLKNRVYQWTWDRFVGARILQELDPPTQRIVYEVQMEFSSHPLVRLFTGHDLPELGPVMERIRQPG
jgi:hypothetical protein